MPVHWCETFINKAFSMRVDLNKFTGFYERLLDIDLTGTVPGIRPPLSSEISVRGAIAKGAPFLPHVYRQDFYTPLDAALPHVFEKLTQEVKSRQKTPADMTERLEQIYAAIYQHGPGTTKVNGSAELRRFLAVVSNLFRSFTDRDKRASAGVKLVTATPPLAFFQSDSEQGPYTIESDLMQQLLGVGIGIVSLPATYRAHPVIWASLSHEVCGHDVIHADEGLLPEMVAAVRSLLAPGGFAPRKQLDGAALNALIWSYWMDEAAADVYGVLNMGPTFPLNLAAFLSAYRARIAVDIHQQPRPAAPRVETDALPREAEPGANRLEDHPVDILRLYLAIGAIEALSDLNATARADYVASVTAVADMIAGGATEIRLEGIIDNGPADKIPVKATIPLPEAAAAAREVGKMIASRKFKALAGHSIQEIETWDDADEAAAQAIAASVAKGGSIAGHGDDAQLLAGATLALLQSPALYRQTQALLDAALDDSYRTDPIWGALAPDHAFAPRRFRRPQARVKAAAARAKKSAGKTAPRGRGQR
jgi:hypothetical protein